MAKVIFMFIVWLERKFLKWFNFLTSNTFDKHLEKFKCTNGRARPQPARCGERGAVGMVGDFTVARGQTRALRTELTGQGAKPCEEIPAHQIDELRFVLRINFKCRGPFNIGSVAIGDRQHSQRRAMVTNGNRRADESVRIETLGI